MRLHLALVLVLTLMLLGGTAAQADIIYFTGTDADSNGIDDFFTVNGDPAYLVTSIAGGWPVLPNEALTFGKYISWAADQSNTTQAGVLGALYAYSFNFLWSGATSSTTFDFRWLSDDYLSDITLNGASLGVNNLGAPAPWTTSYFQNGVTGTVLNGLNTIEFLIWNTGGQQPPYTGVSGPTGMAADFTVYGDATPAPPVPEPASLLLFGSGLVGLRAWRKRRQWHRPSRLSEGHHRGGPRRVRPGLQAARRSRPPTRSDMRHPVGHWNP